MADKKLLATIERSATERTEIGISEYKGRKYLDLRVFYTTDEGITWNPTKKGITVAPEKIQEVIDAFVEAKQELGVEDEE